MKECCLVCMWLYHDLQCHCTLVIRKCLELNCVAVVTRHLTGSVLNFCKRSRQWFMRLLFPQQRASFCRALRHILPTVRGRRNGCVIEPTYHGQKVADFQRSQC